jgi:peptide/nickel transport system substrate-binding protein
MALAFRAGAVDVAPQVNDAHGFAATSGSRLVSVPSCQPGYFAMNVKVAPWNDVHVRRAVAYALDRPDLIRANGNPAVPNYTLIPPMNLRTVGSRAQVDALLATIPKYAFNLAKARSELAKSAYPHGFSTTLDSGFPSDLNVQQAIAGELEKIGIHAHVRQISDGAWVARYITFHGSRQYGAMFGGAGCNSPDPSFFTFFLGTKNTASGSYNFANYDPPAVDALITEGITTTNPARRLAIYGRLLKRLAADVPYVPLWVNDGNAAIARSLSWPTFDAGWYNRVWGLEIRRR